jgi:hypothetical protein
MSSATSGDRMLVQVAGIVRWRPDARHGLPAGAMKGDLDRLYISGCWRWCAIRRWGRGDSSQMTFTMSREGDGWGRFTFQTIVLALARKHFGFASVSIHPARSDGLANWTVCRGGRSDDEMSPIARTSTVTTGVYEVLGAHGGIEAAVARAPVANTRSVVRPESSPRADSAGMWGHGYRAQ